MTGQYRRLTHLKPTGETVKLPNIPLDLWDNKASLRINPIMSGQENRMADQPPIPDGLLFREG